MTDPRIAKATTLLASALSGLFNHTGKPCIAWALSDAERAVALLDELYADAEKTRQRAAEVTGEAT